jgi:sugar O-acyltransferase (sialic acid O-acetyltransferase NeuD family)
MSEFIVIGGGGHARVVISILRKLKEHSVLGYTDGTDRGSVMGAPYLGPDSSLPSMISGLRQPLAVLGVGQIGLGRARQELWDKLVACKVHFPSVLSPDAIVNPSVTGGEAATVMDGAVINCGVALGRGVIVNTNSTIEHDTVLGDWVHVAPGATVCGEVTIGPYSMIGAGATVIEGKKIAPCCVVGAGATVVHDLTEPGIYVGSPARRIA